MERNFSNLHGILAGQALSVLALERVAFVRSASPALSFAGATSRISCSSWSNLFWVHRQQRRLDVIRASLPADGDSQESSDPEKEPFVIKATDNRPYFETGEDSSLPKSASAGNTLNQEQLREVLDTLSQSLTVLSSAMSEVSSAVRVLSATLSSGQQHAEIRAPPLDTGYMQNEAGPMEPPEPWDSSTLPSAPTRNVDEIIDGTTTVQDTSIPEHLVQQNRTAHKLAYKLQQNFIQARIDGLGKPFEVAVEDFTDTCIEAHKMGVGLKELQLQLILQDGSLTGAFALRNQRFSNDPIFDEDSRIRSLWVRLVYSCLAQLEEMGKPSPSTEVKPEDTDGTETFIKQIIRKCYEEGYDLARLKLEQSFAGETTSPSVKYMRQNHYLVLLVVDKLKKNKTNGESSGQQDGNPIDETDR